MVTTAEIIAPDSQPSSNPLMRVVRGIARHRLGRIGAGIIILVIAAAIFAPLVAPYDPTALHYDAILEAPSMRFLLGTDEIGRDVLSRLIYGARVSLQVVLIAIGGALVVGSVLGMVAGYFGGFVDDLIMRVMDGLLAFPMLILALAIIAVLGPDLSNAIIAIGVVNVPGFARLVRGQVLSLRELDFIQAAVALGQRDHLVMLRHVWPSVSGNVIVYASLKASTSLITESALAFLGLGAQPPTATWGSMLSNAMQYWDAWWMSIFPGAAIFITVLALNFLGDGLRDVLDARLSEER